MAAANLAACAAFIFQAEGDETVSRDPDDDGNWSSGIAGRGSLVGTKYGVSAPALISWMAPRPVTAATMAALTKDVATAIFAARYWQSMSCATLPGGVDLMVCDMGFNAGDATSIRLLQQMSGLDGDDIDGWCGQQTINAVSAFHAGALLPSLSQMTARVLQMHLGVTADGEIGARSAAAIRARADQAFLLVAVLADAHLLYYRSLAAWSRYGQGWRNRVSARLSAAMRLAA